MSLRFFESVHGTDMARCASPRSICQWSRCILAVKTKCAGAMHMRVDTILTQFDTNFGDFTFHNETQSVYGTGMAKCALFGLDLSWPLCIIATKNERVMMVQMRVGTSWYHSKKNLAILAGRTKHFPETGPTSPDAPRRDSICHGSSVF